jgi:hypothetical protein
VARRTAKVVGGGVAKGNGPVQLGQNGRRFGFRFKLHLSWVSSGFWSNEILEDFKIILGFLLRLKTKLLHERGMKEIVGLIGAMV